MQNIQPHSWLAICSFIRAPCIAYMAIHIQSLRDYEIIQYKCRLMPAASNVYRNQTINETFDPEVVFMNVLESILRSHKVWILQLYYIIL